MTIKRFNEEYSYSKSEKELQDQWFASDLYYWKDHEENSFAIDTPPPTVSGVLHMGHVFSYCHADFIARYQRMRGKNVFYPIGFDDNGLPTERLVEKVKSDELKRKIRGVEMDRVGQGDEFRQMCFEVIDKSEIEFEKLFKSLGISYDWRQKYQTISDTSTQVAHLSFYDLWNKGLVYEGYGPVYWDVVDQTALAQSTIEDAEIEGEEFRLLFYFDRFEGDNESIEIMTTRPEMLKACVAVFVNPNDERYSEYVNKTIRVPIFNQLVTIYADEAVKVDKGTGVVMCCTYGDWQDVEWVKKFKLNANIIISKDGKIDNLDIKTYRQNIINELKNNTLGKNYIKEVTKIKHTVKVGERSKCPIEIIDSKQWYLKSLEFKQDLLKIIEYIDFHPAHMKHRLKQWIEGLNQDWCISRDRAFGIQIPSVKDRVDFFKLSLEESLSNGNNVDQQSASSGAENTLHTMTEKEQLQEKTQVFDTWFTSCTSPQLSSLGINDEYNIDLARHKKLYPNALRPQAHEIIRTWTFGTILKAYLHGMSKDHIRTARDEYIKQGKLDIWIEKYLTPEKIKNELIPWSHVMLSGWCLAKDGSKMSKSKGNALSPVDLISERGADIVRYWAASFNLGVDTTYNETKFIDGKKLINKLWNASKFSAIHFDKLPNINDQFSDMNYIENNLLELITHTSDKWLITKLTSIILEYEYNFNEYEYSKAKEIIERFFWHDFCDNYLELTKPRAYSENLSALVTLKIAIIAILKLFAPFMPHVTEMIWSICVTTSRSIHSCGNWIKIDKLTKDEASYNAGTKAIEIIATVRKMKTDQGLSMNSPVKFDISKENIPADLQEDLKSGLNLID